MAENSLSILLQTNPSAKNTLAESWGKVIANYQKGTISSLFKNTDLSGDPMSGIVNAKRFANITASAYGTARAAGAGNKVKALPVPVAINDNDEFIEEVEEKDLIMYGVDGLIQKRTENHDSAMKRMYERRFFNKGVLAGEVHTYTASTIQTKLEEIIQLLETVQNDFVDGIDRADMCIVLKPSIYGEARTYIDSLNNASIDSSIGEFGMFHGVIVFSSVYLPATVDYLIFVKGAVAQPIRQSILNPSKIELSDATAFGMFLYSGTVAVTDDLIFFAGTLGVVTITTVYGGVANHSVITVTSAASDTANSFYYLAHASAVAAPVYGVITTGWTEMVLTVGAQDIVFATETKIRVAEVDASGRIIKTSAETTIVKA